MSERLTEEVNVKIFRWLAVSFSLYSRIPMPHFEWNEDDMGHSLVFFPLTGAVIGALIYSLNCFSETESIPLFVRTVLTILIPLLITGGFHIDGFMDTQDALRSYQSKEKKLDIMKDPHIGSFAVIGLVINLLMITAALGIILNAKDSETLFILAGVFVISRILSGITSICFEKAKKDGMLFGEAGKNNMGVLIALFVQLTAVLILMVIVDIKAALAVLVIFALFVLYYRYMTYKQFGGVTGDTAGYFVTVSEVLACIALAAVILI